MRTQSSLMKMVCSTQQGLFHKNVPRRGLEITSPIINIYIWRTNLEAAMRNLEVIESLAVSRGIARYLQTKLRIGRGATEMLSPNGQTPLNKNAQEGL